MAKHLLLEELKGYLYKDERECEWGEFLFLQAGER